MYDDAWMPNMQRITWNGVALHGGPLPGYAASHGCVRMPYGFAEKLFKRLQGGHERFETRLAMVNVVSRAVGVHKLLLLNFYPFLQKYVAPHQRDVTVILAALVQASLVVVVRVVCGAVQCSAVQCCAVLCRAE